MTAYTASNPVPLSALPTSSGTTQQFLVSSTNSGASTFAPDGLAASPIFGLGGGALQGGEIVSGGVATLVSYVGSLLNSGSLCWVLFNCTGGAQQVGAATASMHAAQAGQVASGSLNTATAGGTANAITASFPVSPTGFTNGQPFTIISTTTNTAAMTAVLTLGGTAQASVAIVKGNNQALIAGDFPAGYPGEFAYSSSFGALVMENPASTSASSNFQSISVAVASNALTGTYNAPATVQFRNTTLTSGVPAATTIASNLSLTVPSGATLGTVATIQARIVWLLLYNGGTPVLGVVNLGGGLNLDETTLISSTAISASATASNIVYSTAAVTSSPFRVVGFCDITEATAGTWTTAPTDVQGIGGQALAALSSLGYGQTWQFPTRGSGVTYYNATGRPIFVSGWATSSAGGNVAGYINGNAVAVNGSAVASGQGFGITFIVPPGTSYQIVVSGSATLIAAAELR